MDQLIRILKVNKYHPYKLRLINKLNEDDPDRRVEFCEIMQSKCNEEPDFLKSILFSDECTFYMNSRVCRHNMYYWSNVNPHWATDISLQDHTKVNVWAGIIGNQIIGPFFFDGTLNGQTYLDLLQNHVGPKLSENNIEGEVWFQHDGAPGHYSTEVINYLNICFPEHWIGRRGTIDWPARSPDLTPLDFFLWGYGKSCVYKSRPQTIDELKERILQAFENISGELLVRVNNEIYNRFGYCMIANGCCFEHLIK
jgi:hypothetical protein